MFWTKIGMNSMSCAERSTCQAEYQLVPLSYFVLSILQGNIKTLLSFAKHADGRQMTLTIPADSNNMRIQYLGHGTLAFLFPPRLHGLHSCLQEPRIEEGVEADAFLLLPLC